MYGKRFDKIKENLLLQKAIELLPKSKRVKHFKKTYFENKNKYTFTFIDRNKIEYQIFIDVRKAFTHFIKNTSNEHRAHINGSLMLTLKEPLFVLKEIEDNKESLINCSEMFKFFEEIENTNR